MRRSGFWLKAAAAVLATAALGVGAALVALKAHFPEPRLRAWVVDASRRRLGREVRLERIGLGPRGLTLRGLEVSERPDFAAGTFLRVESFRLRPSWRALLRRRFVVAAVAADGLTVRVVKGADGRFNYETLASPASPAAAAPGPARAPGPELDVRRATLSRATVAYVDAATGAAWTVSDADVGVCGFRLDAPFALTASARVRGGSGARLVDARVSFDGDVDPARGDRAKFRADVRRLTVAADGWTLSASGRTSGLDSPQAAFDAALAWSGKTLLTAAGTARWTDAADVDVKVKTPGFDTTPLARFAPRAGIPALSLPAIDAALTGRFSPGRADIGSWRASWPGGRVAGSVSARALGSSHPVYEGRAAIAADVPALDARRYPFLKLPPGLTLPAGHVDGALALSAGALRLDRLVFKTKAGAVRIDGRVSGVTAGAIEPDVAVAADLSLPALTDRDLPFPGVPTGLRMPPSRWTAELSYAPRLIRIKTLRVRMGRNDVEASGSVADPRGRAALDLLVKTRSFALDEVAPLTPRTRELKLGGSGFFALSVTGNKESPIFAGKLRFQGVGATVSGLPLSGFAGTVSFDPRRVDVSNLTGRIADGKLTADVTVKDYARPSPEIQVEASLDRFDLGRYLAAKQAIVAERRAAAPAAAAPEAKPRVVSTRGHLSVGTLIHPNATVEDVKVGWDLRGVGADLRGLEGDAQLQIGGGRLRAVGDMATQSKLVKVLLFPLLVVQKLGRVGGIRLFPDFNDIALNRIAGDYLFRGGVMTLRHSEMDSDAARASAAGTIDLSAEALDLTVTAQVANIAPIDVSVTGTFEKPKSRVNLGKLLADPAKQLIQGLLRR